MHPQHTWVLRLNRELREQRFLLLLSSRARTRSRTFRRTHSIRSGFWARWTCARMTPPSRCPSEFQEFALDAIDYRNECAFSPFSLGWRFQQPNRASSCRITFRQDLCLTWRRTTSPYTSKSPRSDRNVTTHTHTVLFTFYKYMIFYLTRVYYIYFIFMKFITHFSFYIFLCKDFLVFNIKKRRVWLLKLVNTWIW